MSPDKGDSCTSTCKAQLFEYLQLRQFIVSDISMCKGTDPHGPDTTSLWAGFSCTVLSPASTCHCALPAAPQWPVRHCGPHPQPTWAQPWPQHRWAGICWHSCAPPSSTPKWGPVTSSAYLFLQAGCAQDPAERGSFGQTKGTGGIHSSPYFLILGGTCQGLYWLGLFPDF